MSFSVATTRHNTEHLHSMQIDCKHVSLRSKHEKSNEIRNTYMHNCKALLPYLGARAVSHRAGAWQNKRPVTYSVCQGLTYTIVLHMHQQCFIPSGMGLVRTCTSACLFMSFHHLCSSLKSVVELWRTMPTTQVVHTDHLRPIVHIEQGFFVASVCVRYLWYQECLMQKFRPRRFSVFFDIFSFNFSCDIEFKFTLPNLWIWY